MIIYSVDYDGRRIDIVTKNRCQIGVELSPNLRISKIWLPVFCSENDVDGNSCERLGHEFF